MSGRAKVYMGVSAVVALLVVGFFLRGPMAHIQIPAEKIGQIGPFTLTNTILSSWLSIILLGSLAFFATRNIKLVPGRFQGLGEVIVELMLRLFEGAAGHRNARRFFPAVATIFLFVIANNWMGLLPGYGTIGLVELEEHGYHFNVTELGPLKIAWVPPGESGTTEEETNEGGGLHSQGVSDHQPTISPANEGTVTGMLVPFLRSAATDLNFPLALAVMSAIFVEYWGISTLGFLNYGSKFFNVRRLLRFDLFNGFIDLFVGILELISEAARIVSFTFRLFGNIFAGEVLLAVMGFLVPWVAIIPFYGLELFVGLIQAFIFAMLTLVFGVIAVAGHGGEEHAGGSEH